MGVRRRFLIIAALALAFGGGLASAASLGGAGFGQIGTWKEVMPTTPPTTTET
jgi:hypothetical protein